MLNDIISIKDNIVFKGKTIKEGGSQILGWMYARGGGGSIRCVLCATGGVGGSKNKEKMRM